jgi:hypothetical protein
LVNELQWKKEIIFFEHNLSGQLQTHMVNTLKLDTIQWLTIKHERKYDLYPFFMEDFEDRLLKNN